MVRPTRGALLLIAGDLAMLVLFANAGRRAHEEAAGIEAWGAVLGTAAPFLFGWLVAMAWSARARPLGPATPVEAVTRTVRGWLVAYPIAVLVRAAALGRFSPWSFYLVAALVPLALLFAWRLAFVVLRRRGAGVVAHLSTGRS